MNLIDTTAHFYSDVCPQLAKYYVTIQLAEKHLLSKKHLDGKLGAKYHVTISVFLLSLSLSGRPNNANKLEGWEAIHQSGPPHGHDGDDNDDNDDDADDSDDDE